MSAHTEIKRLDQRPITEALINKNKFRFMGLDSDELIKVFFSGNAWVAIVVLALITFSLFWEGWSFFPQHYDSLVTYRKAGLEYVDIVRDQLEAQSSLARYLNNARSAKAAKLEKSGVSSEAITAELAPFDGVIRSLDEAGIPLDDHVKEMTAIAADIKDRSSIAKDNKIARDNLLRAKMTKEAAEIPVEEIDFNKETKPLRDLFPKYQQINQQLGEKLTSLVNSLPKVSDPTLEEKLGKLKSTTLKYVASFPTVEGRLVAWNPDKPVGFYESFTRFVWGPRWVTQSFWQDWYGMLPLLVGSLAIGIVAVAIAVPLGVGAAVYVNQVASATEQNLIKPYIEFISAIPSVVLGFFGIVFLGEFIRETTQLEILSWVPFFPISERLNIVTSGILLALMTIPTIFTLSEDAINNVPVAYKEASFALGATRLQTIVKIIVPAALSGIISAVLLGLGRVIGETMVVLLCAGNRISIPDFTQGIGFIFQPIHTMTGLIAQEIPEVPKGTLQYRSLFMLSLMLFFISLGINWLAQLIVKRFKISVG